ncbi:phage portal protein [Sanguibacter sp. HDW7]|uniref:phage portal protein n=1 Tax=Sanguibacter sp. HDW7 TaxID=2714931 RepID=UPI00140A4C2D|nr:phage portal protein [Sanguibacter sp. HDW7]QIK82408.1 phage portal protein [Sanguibacter sp. HDW7]
MSIDVKTVQSPGWWLQRLSRKMDDRQKMVSDLFARYEGDAPVPSSLRDAPESAKRFFKAARTAFAEMIVKSVKYPLRLQGVATGVDTGEGGDPAAWRMVVRSGMRTEGDDAIRLALTAGNGYAIVGMHGDEPRYTSEDPRQVVTIHDPVVQSEVLAAAKFFHHDVDERAYAYLYRPGRVWRAFTDRKRPNGARFASSWKWDPEFGGEEGQALPEGCEKLVPVFRYRNEEGVGEFQRHRDLLDRLDHMVLQGMSIATYQAFRQRALKIDPKDMPAEDPETGAEIDYNDVFSADPGSLWTLPPTADLWESGNVDLTPVWTGMEKFTQQLSAVTFTPLAMFSPEGQNQSAAGSAFAREGRTFKIEDRQDRFGETHARALAALFLMTGDTERSRFEDLDIIWRPAERYSLAEKADAAVKAKASNVPWHTIMRDVWQYSPEQIARMESERVDDLFLTGAAASTALPADDAAGDAVQP